MWLLDLPLPPDQRIHLPPGRYLFPWYFQPQETARLAELLGGLLAGVERHLILPWPAVQALAPPTALVTIAGTLLVVTFEDTPADDAVDAVLAGIVSPHVMLQYRQPQETGYAWQERYLKPALVALLQEHLSDESHPLARLNIGVLPIRDAAALTTEAMDLLDLLEALAEDWLAHPVGGTSGAGDEASLYAQAGRKLAERLLRLPTEDVELALEVLMAEGVGAWSSEDFRVGAQALEAVGLARTGGDNVSLGPLARRSNYWRVLAALGETMSSRRILLPRRWLIETAFRKDEHHIERPRTDGLVVSTNGNTGTAPFTTTGVDEPSAARRSRRTLDEVQRWIRHGADFQERCRRARDFLGDPTRSQRATTDRYSEYDVWLDPIKCEFTDDDWARLNLIHLDDLQYDERAAASARRKDRLRETTKLTFRGFQVLDRARFGVMASISRQLDSFLSRRGDLIHELGEWMSFAFEEDLMRGHEKPLFIDLLSWIWADAVKDRRSRRADEARDVMRHGLAVAIKNGYEDVEAHVRDDARAIGLDVSDVQAAGDWPSAFLEKMRQGYEKTLDCTFAEARRLYGEARVLAERRGSSFNQWVALQGEADALRASFGISEQPDENQLEDYRRHREALEQTSEVREWLSVGRERREEVLEETIEAFVRERRHRAVGGRGQSFSNSAHRCWTSFRDLETINAPPYLQRKYVQPLIDFRAFGPAEELRYRLRFDIDKAEKAEEWLSRVIHERGVSLADACDRDDALRSEFMRNDITKFERARRLEVFAKMSDILRVQDLDWAASFILDSRQQIGAILRSFSGHRRMDSDYTSALSAYAKLERGPVLLDNLEKYVALINGRIEVEEFARALRTLPLEQLVGLHHDSAASADRLVRLVLDLEGKITSEGQEVRSGDEDIAWALFSIVRGTTRFGRSLSGELVDRVRVWANHLLHKRLSPEHAYHKGAFNAATHLAYAIAPNEEARTVVLTEALAATADMPEMDARAAGPIGVWLSLVEAGVSPTHPAMAAKANMLSAQLAQSWDGTLTFLTNNPHEAWTHVAFLAELIAAGMADPLPVARQRLLQLTHAAPRQLGLCARTLDPSLWGDDWQSFVDQVWQLSGGGDGPDPVAARTGAVDLLRRWLVRSPNAAREIPDELRFLLDVTLLSILDDSPIVANYAAFNVAGYATHAQSRAAVSRIAGALRRIAVDPRFGVRGAAAYAGTKLPLMNVADEIRAVARKIDKALSEETYAMIQRQRAFGELDAKYPPA